MWIHLGAQSNLFTMAHTLRKAPSGQTLRTWTDEEDPVKARLACEVGGHIAVLCSILVAMALQDATKLCLIAKKKYSI